MSDNGNDNYTGKVQIGKTCVSSMAAAESILHGGRQITVIDLSLSPPDTSRSKVLDVRPLGENKTKSGGIAPATTTKLDKQQQEFDLQTSQEFNSEKDVRASVWRNDSVRTTNQLIVRQNKRKKGVSSSSPSSTSSSPSSPSLSSSSTDLVSGATSLYEQRQIDQLNRLIRAEEENTVLKPKVQHLQYKDGKFSTASEYDWLDDDQVDTSSEEEVSVYKDTDATSETGSDGKLNDDSDIGSDDSYSDTGHGDSEGEEVHLDVADSSSAQKQEARLLNDLQEKRGRHEREGQMANRRTLLASRATKLKSTSASTPTKVAVKNRGFAAEPVAENKKYNKAPISMKGRVQLAAKRWRYEEEKEKEEEEEIEEGEAASTSTNNRNTVQKRARGVNKAFRTTSSSAAHSGAAKTENDDGKQLVRASVPLKRGRHPKKGPPSAYMIAKRAKLLAEEIATDKKKAMKEQEEEEEEGRGTTNVRKTNAEGPSDHSLHQQANFAVSSSDDVPTMSTLVAKAKASLTKVAADVAKASTHENSSDAITTTSIINLNPPTIPTRSFNELRSLQQYCRDIIAKEKEKEEQKEQEQWRKLSAKALVDKSANRPFPNQEQNNADQESEKTGWDAVDAGDENFAPNISDSDSSPIRTQGSSMKSEIAHAQIEGEEEEPEEEEEERGGGGGGRRAAAEEAAAMLPVDVWTASRASPMGMRAKKDSLKVAAVTALMQFNEEELLRFADYFHVENFGK